LGIPVNKQLILLSGGLDSTLCLARYGADLAVGFDYGQPHAVELTYARRVAERYGVPYEQHSLPSMPRVNDVVFAGRNAVMLAVGAAIAQARGLGGVVIGCNFSDAQRFPDCRPEFIRSMDKAMSSAYSVRVFSPLLTTAKQQIVAEGRERGLPETWTCYAPTPAGQQCGECYSCKGIKPC
jgi:7-cyano-7-deazaguanine synthase